MGYELKLFSGNARSAARRGDRQDAQLSLGDAEVSRFSDGEVYVQINEERPRPGRLRDQPTCPPVNDPLDEMRVSWTRASGVRAAHHRGCAVLRLRAARTQGNGRVPITAKLVADLITAAGLSSGARGGLHAGQIPGLFNMRWITFRRPAGDRGLPREEGMRDPVLVSPTRRPWSARAPSPRASTPGMAIIRQAPATGTNVAVFMHPSGGGRRVRMS